MWHNLAGIIGRIYKALITKFHILCFVIASKSYIIGSNIKRHAVTYISLHSWTVTNAALDVCR